MSKQTKKKSNHVQKSYSFIVPLLGFSAPELNQYGFLSSYLGDAFYTGTKDWGEFIYLHFDSSKLDQKFVSRLESSPLYNDDYTSPEGNAVFVFMVPKDKQESIVKPFLNGRYSEIDRTYVQNYFPELVWTSDGEQVRSVNYKILTKDNSLREYWETVLGTELPVDAEVWAKPEPKDEIYYYDKALIAG